MEKAFQPSSSLLRDEEILQLDKLLERCCVVLAWLVKVELLLRLEDLTDKMKTENDMYNKYRIENNCEHLDNEASTLLRVQIISSETKMNKKTKQNKQINRRKGRKKKRKWKQKEKKSSDITNKRVTPVNALYRHKIYSSLSS